MADLNQRDMAKQLLTPLRLIPRMNFSLINYGCELFNLNGKVELIPTSTTAICKCLNVSNKYNWDNVADRKQLSMNRACSEDNRSD